MSSYQIFDSILYTVTKYILYMQRNMAHLKKQSSMQELEPYLGKKALRIRLERCKSLILYF